MKTKKPKRGRGDKTSNTDILHRVEHVTELMVAAKGTRYIVTDCVKRFKVDERTARRYIAEALNALKAAFKHDVGAKSQIVENRLEKLYNAAAESNNVKEAVMVLDRIAKLHGLFVERAEVTHDAKDNLREFLIKLRKNEF